MGKAANLKVNVTSNSQEAQNALNKISSQLTGISKLPSSTGFVAGLGVWTNAIGTVSRAVGKVVNSTKELVDLYTVQAQAELRLQGTLRATGNQIGMNATELGNMASGFQAVTRFGDEMILPMQQIFIATQKLTKEQLPEVIELSLDMAEAMGTDGASAAKIMARAMADPISGLESLKEKNVFFTQSEKDKIKELVNSNRLMDAQRIILDKVASAYGGIAREVAATDIGKMQQINNLMGDIKEGLGEMIVGSIEPAFGFIQTELERIYGWIENANRAQDERKAKALDAENFQNGNLAAVSTEFLTAKVTELQDILANAEADPAKRIWAPYYEQLDAAIAEVTRRYNAPKPSEPPTTSRADSDASNREDEEKLSLYKQILSATSATEAAQKKVLQDRIADNKHLRDHLDLQVSAKKMTQEEADLAKEMLDQQIKLDREKLNSFDKKDPPPTAAEYISENSMYSLSAQEAAIDAEIAKAEAHLETVSSTSQEAIELREIIDSLREQKALLTEQEDIFESIMAATGSTEAAQKRALQDRILENIALRDSLALKVKSGELTREEAEVASEALSQQIALDQEKIKSFSDKTPEEETASDFIGQNRTLSQTAQLSAIDSNITLAESYLEAAEAGSEEEKAIQEIIAALKEQRNAITEVEDRSGEFLNAFANGYKDLFNSLSSLTDQLYQNQINQLQETLDKQQDAWDSYYSDIQDKYKADRDSLDAQYQWGRISAEEYYASLTALSDAKTTAEEENADSEEELMKQMDELKRKQFAADKANSIMQATISGAQAVASIWSAWAANPVYAGILTGLSVATVGAQIATIASQQYTPLAEGGVVTGPTTALIGEGGEPEMVLPLSKADDMGFNNGGVINLNISTGNVYSMDDLVRAIFEAIERAQRTGALPRWRYAA
jgi:hypothetical protein